MDGDAPLKGETRPSSLEVILPYICWAIAFLGVVWAGTAASIVDAPRRFSLAYTLTYPAYVCLAWFALSQRGHHVSRGLVWLILCILLRVPLLGVEPSDDAHRYVWEGRIQQAGYNPFALAPDDMTLAHLRNSSWEKINHPDYPAIYPPLAQLEFRLVSMIQPTIATVKNVHVLWDVLTLVVLYMCLIRLGLPTERVVLYGACPLVLSAFAVEGHIDAFMVFFVALTWLAVLYRAWSACALAMGASMSVKFFPVVLLPWFGMSLLEVLWKHPEEGEGGGHRRGVGPSWWGGLLVVVVAVGLLLVSYVPFLDAGWKLAESLRRFALDGTFANAPEHLLGISYSGRAMKGVLFVWLLVMMLVGLRRRWSFDSFAMWISSWFLLVTPVFHYWYAAIPFLFLTSRVHFGWIAGASVLGWYFEAFHRSNTTGEWELPGWVPFSFWWLFVIGTAMQILLSRQNRMRCPGNEQGASVQS